MDALLDFNAHLSVYERQGLLEGKPDRDEFWHHRAQELHASYVTNAIAKLQIEIVSLGQVIGMGDAYHHLVFGAGRRSKMIWGAFRALFSLIAPDRTAPLPPDDVFEAARSLNDIYIHTLGMLDNYAWVLMYMFGDAEARDLHPNEISLFRKKFRSNVSMGDFVALAEPFAGWEKEIKMRRDPVAHRIPLSIPPSLLNDEDQREYHKVNQSWNEAQRAYIDLRAKMPRGLNLMLLL